MVGKRNRPGEQKIQTIEELQIQVRDKDKGVTMMWSEQEFDDKLEMMREALALYEDNLQKMQETPGGKERKASAEEQELKQLNYEIFEKDEEADNLRDVFLKDLVANLDTDHLNKQTSFKEEEKKPEKQRPYQCKQPLVVRIIIGNSQQIVLQLVDL